MAVNAAQDATDLVAKLRAFHNEAQVNPDRKNLKWQVSSEGFTVKCVGDLGVKVLCWLTEAGFASKKGVGLL